eukprot:jgi/Chlat1/1430/Chrsp12S01996
MRRAGERRRRGPLLLGRRGGWVAGALVLGLSCLAFVALLLPLWTETPASLTGLSEVQSAGEDATSIDPQQAEHNEAEEEEREAVSPCDQKLLAWLDKLPSAAEEFQLNNNKESWELAFFLHVPRTGGRALHRCLMVPAVPTEKACPVAYHRFRLRGAKPCTLLTSHDDYSLLPVALNDFAFAKVPHVAVVTHIRDPVARMISAYEFAITTGMRRDPMARHQFNRLSRFNATVTPTTNTLSIWPWSYLVPLMKTDMERRAKVDRALYRGESQRVPVNPYDNADIMPLKDFVRHPMAHDLLHNGNMLSMLGLTNNSWHPDATELRQCVPLASMSTRAKLVAAAKKRLMSFTYVGVTEQHANSARLLAHTLGWQLSAPVVRAASQTMSRAFQKPVFPAVSRVTDRTLGLEYVICTEMNKLRSPRESLVSLARGRSQNVTFSKEARKSIPPDIIDYIKEHSALDLELHQFATELFQQRLDLAIANGLEELPAGESVREHMKLFDETRHAREEQRSKGQVLFDELTHQKRLDDMVDIQRVDNADMIVPEADDAHTIYNYTAVVDLYKDDQYNYTSYKDASVKVDPS